MGTVVTRGALIIAPTQVNEITSERDSGVLVHEVLGRPVPDVTLRPASSRKGTLEMLFAGVGAEDASAAAEDAHTVPGMFTIASDERPTLSFSYVPVGRITRVLDAQTRDVWLVRVEYREITP